MIRKRYVFLGGYIGIKDNITNDEYPCNKDSFQDVCELLNEQHEQIQSLQFQLKECREHKLYSRRELEEENEQLKQQKQQYKGQRDYLLFVIERTCSKELFEETKSYLKEVE